MNNHEKITTRITATVMASQNSVQNYAAEQIVE
jgi:hypothetical protein